MHLLVKGLPRHKAYREAFNSKSKNDSDLRYRAKKRLEGVAGEYYNTLMDEVINNELLPVVLSRAQRLRMLSTLTHLCMDEYRINREPQQANAVIKAINTMNNMTGDNATQDINVNHTVINADLTQLTPNDATLKYKEMMNNINARLEKMPRKTQQETEGGDT